MRAQAWLVAVVLVLLSVVSPAVADQDVGGAVGDPKPPLASFDSFDDGDDDWDRIFEQQRRLDAMTDTEGEGDAEGGQPIGRALEEVIPGLPGVDLRAFNAELAQKETLERVVDWAYDLVAARSSYQDSFVHAEDLPDLLLKTLNPLDDAIETEDEQLLAEAARALRLEQGLVDDEMVVYRGFITRGSPLRFLQETAHRMHEGSPTSRRRLFEEL